MATEGIIEHQTSNASNGNSKNGFGMKKTMPKSRKSSASSAFAFHIRTALVGSYRTKKTTTANKQQVEFSSERTADLTRPSSSASSLLNHHQDTSSSSSSSNDDADDQRTPSETEEVVPGDNKIVDMDGIRQATSKEEDEILLQDFQDQEDETSNMKMTTNKKRQEIITLDAFALVLSLPGNHKINRIGLDKLYRVVKRSKVNLRDKEASRAIVIGGESTRSSEEQLREALLYYLCKEGEEESKLEEEGGCENSNEDDDDGKCTTAWSSDEASTDSLYVEDEDDQDQDEENKYDVSKTSWLELHLLALKILARALDSLTTTRRDNTAASTSTGSNAIVVVDGKSGSDDDVIVVNIQGDAFWPQVVDMLLYNVSERQLPTPVHDDTTSNNSTTINVRIIGYSLKIFRLLHSIDSMGGMMQQMFHQSLLPYVTYLKQICKEQEQDGGGNKAQFSMIAYETSKLLKKANY